jgi:hypothetical protein
MKENFTFTVKKDIRAAFLALTDLKAMSAFSQGKMEVSQIPGTPSAGPGSALLLRLPVAGGHEVRCETVEWDEPRRCVRRFAIPDLPTTVSFDFMAQADCSTKISVDVELTPQSMLYKMMLPILAKQVLAKKDQALLDFQRQLEQA